MIAVTIGNNLKRARFNFNPNTTIRQALENTAGETGIDYSAGMLSLDGSTIGGADLDKTFTSWATPASPITTSAS